MAIRLAHPIHAFSGRIGLKRRRIVRIVERVVWLAVLFGLVPRSVWHVPCILGVEGFFQPGPAHFFGDDSVAVGMVHVFIEQFGILVGASIAFPHEFFIIELVPFLIFGWFVFLGSEGFAEFLDETGEPRGGFD